MWGKLAGVTLALQKLFGKGKRLRYLCQDESRMGLKTEPRRVVTTRGVQPIVHVGWKRQNFWIYGVVEPLTGWQFCQEYPQLNSKHFQEFLDAVRSPERCPQQNYIGACYIFNFLRLYS
jgi:hypothetical protein